MPASQHYPWSDDQLTYAYQAANRHSEGFDRDDVREMLRGFRDAGIGLKFPSYWCYENHVGQWFVIRGDGTSGDDHVACYERSHPHPERAALLEAARLNREFGPREGHLDG
jgi:hypothetical protein